MDGIGEPSSFTHNSISDFSHAESKRFVFICSPFAGDIAGNTLKAIRYMRFAVARGAIPFAPHLLYPQVFDEADSEEREIGLSLGVTWLQRCDELWVFGQHISDGMAREISRAMRITIPIRYFDEICEEVFE